MKALSPNLDSTWTQCCQLHRFVFILLLFRLTIGMKKVEKETTVPDLIESSGFKVRF